MKSLFSESSRPSIDANKVELHKAVPIPAGSPGAAMVKRTIAGQATSKIELGTAVVPSYPRHPSALAQQAATANALAGGRLVLGVGPSHAPVIEALGLAYERPEDEVTDKDRDHACPAKQPRHKGQ